MTTYIQFTPQPDRPFTFTAKVGSETLFASVPFNLYSNRYYVQLKDGKNQIVCFVPLIESPDGFDINLALPYSPGKLIYRASTRQFEAS